LAHRRCWRWYYRNSSRNCPRTSSPLISCRAHCHLLTPWARLSSPPFLPLPIALLLYFSSLSQTL